MGDVRRLSVVFAASGCLALSVAGPASAVDGHDDQLLPNVDVRSEQTVNPVAPKQADRLERSLGQEGFVESSEQTGARSFVGRTDGFLTARSDADPADIVLDYIRANRAAFGLDANDLDALVLKESYTSVGGVTHVTFNQQVDGIDSFDSFVIGNVTKDGRLINVSGAPLSDLSVPSTDPTLTADEALLAARDNVGGPAKVPPVKKRSQGPERKTTYETYAESAQLTVFAQAGADRLAWDVQVLDDDSILYRVVVDAASGDVLARQSLTAFDNNDAEIWPLHPSQTEAPTAVNFGTDPSWLDRSAANGNQLIGNNTHTYVDNNGTNGYQSGEQVTRNGGIGGDWTYPMAWFNHAECPTFGCTWDSTNVATKATNRNPGAVGLFYLTNHFHDHLLKAPIGFDEASRNFEHVNSTGQGVGNDAVFAEAQDSSGVNNANFSTPADGTSGRMQMYMWSGQSGAFGPQYDVDGSPSADVVYHEYAHGLSNRLVGNGGGLTALQSRSMGEGWSDFYALDLLVAEGSRTDPAGPGDVWLGEYVTGVPGIFGGISRIRYQAIDCPVGAPADKCPAPDTGTAGSGGFTFGDLGKIGSSSSVHNNGEIWSQTMWDLRTALGRNNALKIITGGMRLSPMAPSMLDMRNAILQSAAVSSVDVPTVWSVFAARGMGENATTPNSGATTAVEDFTAPPNSVTDPATNVTTDAATLNGLHKSGGKPTDYVFEFGPTAAYGQATPVTPGGAALNPIPVSAPIAGLTPNTEYHYRLVGLRSGVVVSEGADRVFTTASPPPPPPAQVQDATVPVVKITKAPKKKITTKKAKVKVKVKFTSEAGATFTCKIDKKKYKACTSPASFKAKSKPGKGKKHTIYVVAKDAAGNSSKPATAKFKVIRK